MMQLKRAFLVEKVPGTGTGWENPARYQLNDRGIAHFAEKATKAAKADQKAPGEGLGTCQICERSSALVRDKIALHGYARPGDGVILGRCHGAGHLPFEQSKDRLEGWIDTLESQRDNAKKILSGIPARTEMRISVPVVDEFGAPTYRRLEGGKGGKRLSVPVTRDETITADDPRFVRAKADLTRKIENEHQGISDSIRRQKGRAAGWQPVDAPTSEPTPAPKVKPPKAEKVKPAPAPAPPPVAKPLSASAKARAEASERRVARAELRAQLDAMKPRNAKRIAAAKIAAEASAEKRREIHSAIRGNLSSDMHVVWDKEGEKFFQQESHRIKGIKDPINAASKISEAFTETYGSGEATTHGNEGDRFYRRAVIEAEHADKWAEDQERKHYEDMHRAALDAGEIDHNGELTKRGRAHLEDDLHEHESGSVKAHSVADTLGDDPPF